MRWQYGRSYLHIFGWELYGLLGWRFTRHEYGIEQEDVLSLPLDTYKARHLRYLRARFGAPDFVRLPMQATNQKNET
jgi:hypothetical protein